MTYSNEYSKTELENLFANDFSSAIFPFLAEIYLEEKDMYRARKVCELGIFHDTNNYYGKYILSKIELLDGNILNAEQMLKDVINHEVALIQALKLYIEVRMSLKRSIKQTKHLVDKLLKYNTQDQYAIKWIEEHSPLITNAKGKDVYKKVLKNKKVSSVALNDSKRKFKIDKSLVSFTFYKTLKKQKHYREALNMLDLLGANKKVDIQTFKKEKKQLHKIINR